MEMCVQNYIVISSFQISMIELIDNWKYSKSYETSQFVQKGVPIWHQISEWQGKSFTLIFRSNKLIIST